MWNTDQMNSSSSNNFMETKMQFEHYMSSRYTFLGVYIYNQNTWSTKYKVQNNKQLVIYVYVPTSIEAWIAAIPKSEV